MAAITSLRTRRAPASAGSAPPPRPRLSIVRPQSRRPQDRPRRALWLALAVLLVSLLVVGAAHAYLVAGQVRLARLQQQLDSAQDSERNLEVRVAQLASPSRVVSQAEQQGLRVPIDVTDLPMVAVPASRPGAASASSSHRNPKR